MPGARRHVDVVEAHGVVRHHREPGPRGVQELLIDPVGEQRDRPRLPGHLPQQLLPGHHARALVQRHVAPGRDPVQGFVRQPPGDQDRRTRRTHRKAPRSRDDRGLAIHRVLHHISHQAPQGSALDIHLVTDRRARRRLTGS